jgi:predicted  nucleic acid-binding Zn-ribbon protein
MELSCKASPARSPGRVPDEELPLKADPFAQLKLLDLQHVDSTLDQLTHQARTLPEHAALAALAERRTDVSDAHGRLTTEVSDLARAQRKADADVEQVRTRRSRNRDRIDGGLVSDPKQLQAMQHEIRSLDNRISDLEDEELEVMEQLEGAQSRLGELDLELAEIDSTIGELTRKRDEAAVSLGERRNEALAERELLVADIPADLLKLYDKLRTQLGGVAAGALHHRRCGGCQLDIGAADLARMTAAPSDEVLRCEECDRILVRTHESGI